MAGKTITSLFSFLFFGLATIVNLPMSHASESKNFCLETGVVKHLLIDVTSVYDDRAKHQIQDGFSKIISGLMGGEKVVISTIENSFTASRTIYEGCVPHCDGATIVSNCTEGFLILEKRKQLSKLRNALAKNITQTIDLPNSDIFRTLYFSTKEQQKDPTKLVLIIFSDMIENSDFISGNEFFSSVESSLMAKLSKDDLLPNFMGADIVVFGIGRGGTTGREPLKPNRLSRVRKHWGSYFKMTGAKNVEISESYIPN